MLLSLPYAGVKCYEGVRLGRYHEVLNHIQRVREEEAARQEAEARQRPEVQFALQAIADVKGLLHRKSDLEARVARDATARDSRIAALEALRPAEREELDALARNRIQDHLDNLAGAQPETEPPPAVTGRSNHHRRRSTKEVRTAPRAWRSPVSSPLPLTQPPHVRE